MTESEALLWERLRDRRLAGLKFRRQHQVGPYVLDFCCLSLRLVVEVDGGVHGRKDVAAADRDRQANLEELGFCFLRVPAERVVNDIDAVVRQIEAAAATPAANPPPP